MDDGECTRMTGFNLVIICNDILKKIELELIVNFHGLYFKADLGQHLQYQPNKKVGLSVFQIYFKCFYPLLHVISALI